MNPRSICLCVDDFGLHDGVNQAALRLAGMGRVHAVGCMVGAPAWQGGAGLARHLDDDGLDLGLHLDLTEHPVLAATPRMPLRHLILASQLRSLRREPLRAEIRAQLDAFESAIGRAPDFIDGHQHVHQFPVVRDALLDEVEFRYGAHRPWLRSTGAPSRAAPAGTGWRARIKPWVIERLGAAGLDASARRRGHRQNRALLGVYPFEGGAEGYRTWLAAWLEGAQNGDLLMCHPSLRVSDPDPLMEARVAEFEVLAAPSFDALIGALRITLRPMSQILAATRSWQRNG